MSVKSFEIDHTILEPGFYINSINGDVTTYDLRFTKPYSETILNNSTLHTIEHLMAHIIRELIPNDVVLYFGPMGCQTGFYLLVRNRDTSYVLADDEKYPPTINVTDNEVLNAVFTALRRIITWDKPIPGDSKYSCGNHFSLNLESAKKAVSKYILTLVGNFDIDFALDSHNFDYPQNEED